MTIYRTAYDTFLGQSHKTDRFVEAVVNLDIHTDFLIKNSAVFIDAPKATIDYPGTVLPSVISPCTATEANMVPITFPTLVKVPAVGSVGEREFLVSDARTMIRGTSRETATVTNQRDFEFLRARTILGALWLGKGTQPIHALSSLLPAMYAFWLADKIAQRYVLDADEQVKARCVAYHFYQCLFIEPKEPDENDQRKVSIVASRLVFANPKIAMDIFAKLPHITGAAHFITVLQQVLQNPRIDDLNVGTLANLMAATWYQEGKEQAVVAIEHPPTFCAMVYSAFAQRGFRNTQLSKTLEKFKGAKGEAEVQRAISIVLNG